MTIKRFHKAVIGLLAGVMFLTSCSGKVNIDPDVTTENVNLSAANVAHGFVQAVFTDNRDLFFMCYPDGLLSLYGDDKDELFDGMREGLDLEQAYYGIDFTALNEFTEDNGYDLETMKDNISVFHNVDVELIEQVQIVKERVYFVTSEKNKYDATDVYMIVYKLEGAWYLYELANSDAEFAA